MKCHAITSDHLFHLIEFNLFARMPDVRNAVLVGVGSQCSENLSEVEISKQITNQRETKEGGDLHKKHIYSDFSHRFGDSDVRNIAQISRVSERNEFVENKRRVK